ncbi:MAG: hypothetical protein AB2A00_39500 [Myxococcota bacterium]
MALLLSLACAAGSQAPDPATSHSLAVFPLEAKMGVPAQAADLITDNLVAEIRGARAFFRVVTPGEIAQLMPPEQQKFLMRCASDECVLVDQEMAGALGVSHLLVGNVGKLGNSHLINLRLIELRTSTVLATLSERVKSDNVEQLLDVLKPVVRRLLVDGGMVAPEAPATTEGGPSVAARVLRVAGLGGTALSALPAVLALALGAGWAGVAVLDLVGGYRPPNGRHALTPTQALLANGLLVGTWLSGALAVVGGALFLAVLASSWVVP